MAESVFPSRILDAPPKMPLMLKLLGQFVVKGDPKPSSQQLDHFGKLSQFGDPLGDDVARMYRRLPAGQGRRLLEQALEQGIEGLTRPPRELVALFDAVDQQPLWVDGRLLKIATHP